METIRRAKIVATLGLATAGLGIVACLVLVAAVALLAPGTVPASHAQESPRLTFLDIAVWPEFDSREAALVILRGKLADGVPLPATVALHIPASSGGPFAVASAASEDDDLINVDYEVSDAEDSILITMATPNPLFQVEFYDPMLIDGENRSFTYVWPGDLAVDELTLAVQEPTGATALAVEPELGDRAPGPGEFTYRTAQIGAFESGETLTMNVSYVKTDPRTTLEILRAEEGDSDGGVPSWTILAAAIAALAVVVAAAAYWRWQRRPAASPARPAPHKRGKGRADAAPGEDTAAQAFCTQCGAELRPGDDFCPKCGTAARER